jgi:hypothetical protein
VSEQLKPCPFCGAPSRIRSNRDWHRIDCDHLDTCPLVDSDFAWPATDEGRAALVESWNTRAPVQSAPDGERVARAYQRLRPRLVEAVLARQHDDGYGAARDVLDAVDAMARGVTPDALERLVSAVLPLLAAPDALREAAERVRDAWDVFMASEGGLPACDGLAGAIGQLRAALATEGGSAHG